MYNELYLMQNLDKLSSWDIFIIKLKILCSQLITIGFVLLGIILLVLLFYLCSYLINKIKNKRGNDNETENNKI